MGNYCSTNKKNTQTNRHSHSTTYSTTYSGIKLKSSIPDNLVVSNKIFVWNDNVKKYIVLNS